jgi:protoporphyrinogen/coproporphyrinogen III oxidase
METNHGSIIRASRAKGAAFSPRRSAGAGSTPESGVPAATPAGDRRSGVPAAMATRDTQEPAPSEEPPSATPKWDHGTPKSDSGARYSLFVSFKKGMQALVRELESRLPPGAVHLHAAVVGLARHGSGWLAKRHDGSTHAADAVILACPAYASADMVRPLDAGLADELAALEYASSATMTLAFRRDQIDHPLHGFGFVVPAVEGRSLIAVTFNSVKFAGRAPEGWVLMRAFLGGAMHPHVYARDDEDLKEAVLLDLRELLGVRGQPRFIEIHRWPRSMPQYPVGHLDRVRRIENHLEGLPGLTVAGNAFGGVGVPDCVQSAERAAALALKQD